MSNNRDHQRTQVNRPSPQAFTEGSIDSHFIMASLEAFNAEIAVHLQAEKVSAGELKAKFVKSEGPITAPTASIAGDIASSNVRVSRDVTADQVLARSIAAETVRAKQITGARLRGTVAEALRGVAIGDGVSAVICTAQALTVTDPAARVQVEGDQTQFAARRTRDATSSSARREVEPSPGPRAPLPPPSQPVPPRVALYHDFDSQRDQLVLNHLGRYRDGVRIAGDVQIDGAVLESSSVALKDDVEPLIADAAVSALSTLEPVSFRYLGDQSGNRRLGFIAEDVPEIIAQPARDRIRTMDVVALLTAVVRDQQRTITSLTADVAELKKRD
jgi:hypothetical protein